MYAHRHAAYRLAAVALLIPLGACSTAASQAANQPTSKQAATPAVTTVDIKTFAFSPRELHVPVGGTVAWTNRDDILHTVTSGTRDKDAQGQPVNVKKDGAFDAQLDGPGKTTSHTFATAGTFTYFCDRHPGMDASVVVG